MIRTAAQRAFTLVEMIVALFVLSAAVMFITVVVNTTAGTRDAANESRALRIAESKLEEMRAAGYASLPADGTFSSPEVAYLPSGEASTTVSVWNAQTKKAAVGVSWQSQSGAVRYVSLTTLIASYGGL